MKIVCTDLESVLIPEIWIYIADKTGIKELHLTTREVPDFDYLMKMRLKVLREHDVKLKDIQKIIKDIKPLRGATDFLEWLRERYQVIVLSDSFNEFISVLNGKLSYPTVLCNDFKTDENGFIKDYTIKQKDSKRKSVRTLKSLGFNVIAVGDSYNDISMMKAADVGILFNASDNVKRDFPRFPTVDNYQQLKLILEKYV